MRQSPALSPPAGNAANPIPLLLLLAGVWLSAPAVASTPAPQADPPPASGVSLAPVSAVDLNRYAGLWYEIARIPNRFQRQCVRDSLAVYTLRSDGTIAVVNQCV